MSFFVYFTHYCLFFVFLVFWHTVAKHLIYFIKAVKQTVKKILNIVASYMGRPQNTVSKSLTGYLQNSAIKDPMTNKGHQNLTRQQLN